MRNRNRSVRDSVFINVRGINRGRDSTEQNVGELVCEGAQSKSELWISGCVSVLLYSHDTRLFLT